MIGDRRASKPSRPIATSANHGKGDYPRASEPQQAPSLPCPARGRCIRAQVPYPEPPAILSPAPPTPLLALSSYLEKLRDFPPGQILLGFVGVHGCTTRALGRRRGGSLAAVTWAGAEAGTGGVRAHGCSPRSGAHSHTLCQTRALFHLSPRGLWSPRSRLPVWMLVPAPELRALNSGKAASRVPRQRDCQGRGGGRGGGRTARRTPGSSPPARLPALRAALRASRSRVCGGGQSRCAGRHRMRGWGPALAGNSQAHPSVLHSRQSAALP